MTQSLLQQSPLWLCVEVEEDVGALKQRLFSLLEAVSGVVLWLRWTPRTPLAPWFTLAKELVERAGNSHRFLVFMGERLDLAIAAKAHGVHLGARAIPAEKARVFLQRSAPEMLLSAAVHDGDAVQKNAEHCDALIASPVFSVPEKGPALGPGGLVYLRSLAPAKHVVALGGILTEEHAKTAAQTGANAIAVRRVLLGPEAIPQCIALRDAFLSNR